MKGGFMLSPFANDRGPDDPSGAHVQRVLQGASDAALFGHRLRMLDIEAAHRLALHHSHFNPNQPRVPAGHPDGGQWTGDGSSEGPSPARLAALDPTHLLPGLIKSDTAPGGIRVWTKYAEAKSGDEDQSKTD